MPSNDNQLIGNHAYDNDGSGIEIEGGSGHRRPGNLLERNHIGIRVKNDASLVVEDNRVADSRLAGVDVLSAGDEARSSGTTSPGVGERLGARQNVGPAQRQHPQRGLHTHGRGR